MRKYLHSDFSIILVLVLLFLLIRIPILFTFQGILGGNESYYILKLLYLLKEGQFDAFWQYYSIEVDLYITLSVLLQVPFVLPFYLLFPTNEMSSFFGSIVTNTVLLVSLFAILNRFNGRRVAVYASAMFILSPIGFTVSTVSSDSFAGNLYIFGFLLFFYFLCRSQKGGIVKLLVVLPLLSPYYFLLWPGYAIYVLLHKYFEKGSALFRDFFAATAGNYKKFIIPGILFMAANVFMFYLLVRKGRVEIFFLTGERLADYFFYFKQVFVASGIENLDALSALTHTAFFIFMFLLVFAIVDILKRVFVEKKVFPLLLPACFCLIFFAAELLGNNRFVDYLDRVLVIRIQHVTLIITIGMILIAFVAANRKRLRVLLMLLLALNFITNLSIITTPKKNNNFVNYNTGIIDYAGTREKDFFITNKKALESLESGMESREIEPFRLAEKEIDYRLYGYGMHIYYNNAAGINFCNILPGREKVKACKEGYGMMENKFELYLEKEY
ncbi:MAG: hypothetical protein GY754_19540 [bacterium]|nr:hypothetical protein [bacterium]